MEIYSNTLGRIDFFAEDRIILKSVYGEAVGREMRELYLAGLQCMAQHDVTKLLSDYKSLLPLGSEEAHWINWTWFPAMRSRGWRHWAIVRPASPVAASGLRDYIDHFALLDVQSEVFEDMTAARNWLRDQTGRAHPEPVV